MTTKLTAAECREIARKAHESAIESFDRCDTDGALSQWASQITVRQYQQQATLAENDYMWTFETLVDSDGNLVPCREINTRYGVSYGVYATYEDAIKCGEIIKWVGTGKRAAANKGYKIAIVKAEAKTEIGQGLAPMIYFAPVLKVFTPENCTVVEVL